MTRTEPWLPAATTAAALALSALLITATGGSPTAALQALIQGSLGDPTAISQTLLYAAPLLLVAVGTCCSTRSGAFNIGQEGQVLIGALAGATAGLRLAAPEPALPLVVLLAAALAAGTWAWLSALMHRLRGVDIAVSTLLTTFLAQQAVAYAVTTPWLLQESRLGAAAALPQSNTLPPAALLGSLGDHPALQLNLGLAVALAAALLAAVTLDRTRWGLRLTMTGLNPAAAQHAGVPVAAVNAAALATSGALAGMAGAVLLTSPLSTNRLQPDLSINIGWDGLLVALIARNRPLLTIPVAALFAALRAGGSFLAATGVPPYLVDVVKALLTLALVAGRWSHE
ncbi:ABC transporter permease [Catenuloplanes indicus]|uniref:Simple sugar transport system permease protein n=1 Tax=Catenuloplanes indicus TaxID=137267 RepID=A0AAE3VV52_9ACTN|nr:ABC transporter permease [Catenuloplanes indicus]MDQ0363595.1 simple sugar transport system permease protein [Catenuloplanes indicus]